MTKETIINLIAELPTYEKCVFRGENKEYGKVSSKLYRQYCEGEGAIKRENFSILTVEKDLIDKAKPHISSTASNIEVLTELQHYGGKTALIDFTHNVLIALFFACDGEFEKDGRIIVFDKSKIILKTDIDYENKDADTIIAPTGKSPRVIFQSSVFIHTKQGYLDEKDYKSIITIKKDQKQELLTYLREYFHIETATIYNDIHGFIQNQDNYSTAETEFYRGLAFHNNKEFEQAIQHYTQAIKLKPQLAEVYNNRGNAESALDNKKEAIADYDKAIEINPQSAEAYNNRGNAKYALGDKKEAIADYDKAIEINPQSAEAYYNRGIAKYDLGDKKEAIADYDKAIEINPKFAKAYNNRGIAKVALGDQKEAIADYDKTIEINPQHAEAYNNRGNVKSDLGDQKEAIADYDKAIEINPQSAEAYYNRGNAKSDLGDKKGAIADYDKAIEINPQYAKAYTNRGTAKSDLGDKKGAMADYIQAKTLFEQQGQIEREHATKIEQLLQDLKNDN